MEFRLSNLVQVVVGHTFRTAIAHDEKGNFDVVQAKNINSTGALDRDLTKTNIEKTRTKAFVQNGDILLTNRGAFRAAQYEGADKNIIAASSLYILRVNDLEKLLPKYLAIYLNSKAGQISLDSKNRGATVRSLPKSSLLDIVVPIPSPKDQKRIISINENYKNREHMYKRKAQLHKEIAHETIYKLITS